MSKEKELAYRYDLFITPGWRDRFDTLVNEKGKLPKTGRLLDINTGTGAHAIEIAQHLQGKGEVIGIDPDAERIEIARAKKLAKKLDNVIFEQGSTSFLQYPDDEFDTVLGDASLLPTEEIEDLLEEMVRVAQPGARVVLKLVTRGSFGEFFSIYWEALHKAELDEEVWGELESLINDRLTVSDAELMAERAGLDQIESFTSKEEFLFETGEEFINSPLIEDTFLDEWLSIVPEDARDEVRSQIVSLIERERHNAPFDISIKATLVWGIK